MKNILIIVIALLALPLFVYADSKMNPDLSLNTLLLYQAGSNSNNPDSESPSGFQLQEAELRLTSNIDAYFRGDAILAVESEDGEFIVEPEEVFVETLQIPQVTIRVGKFYPYWGRSNQWHTHAYPFVDSLQTRDAIFGEEGFNESGVAISYLIPASWYSEFVAQAFSAKNTTVFGSENNDDLASVFMLRNLWDLNTNSTLEFSFSTANGDDVNSESNKIYNMAVTYKNKKNDSNSLTATVEHTKVNRHFTEDEVTPGVFNNDGSVTATSAWLQYQFLKRWWLQARHEIVSYLDDPANEDLTKSSALVGYVPTEFSAIRAQYDLIDDPAEDETEKRFMLQLNLTMGAHPAHQY